MKPESIHWLPNGADVQKINVIAQKTAREQLGIASEAVLIGHLGQAFPNDAGLMADAFHIVQNRFQRHSCCLLVNTKQI